MTRHLITVWIKRIAHGYGCLFMLLALASCAPAPEAPLRIATHPWPGYETLHLAQHLGYFKPGIRITEMANASQSALALRNGTIEAACLTLDEVLNLTHDGVDLRVVLVMDVSNGADAALATPAITGLHALRGKRIALENGAVGAIMLDAMLEAASLKTGDVELVSATIDEHEKTYLSGKVDAVITFEPVRSALLKRGAHVLFDSSRIPGRIMDVLAVRNDQLLAHRHALGDVISAYFRALEYQARQPQEAANIIAPFLNVSALDVPAQYAGIKIPTLAENHDLLSGASPKLDGQAAELAGLMLRHQLLRRQIHAPRLADPAFLSVPAKP